MSALVVEDERDRENRYAAYVCGRRVGRASAIVAGETVLVPHVEVEPDKRALGIGSLLVRRILDDARTEGRTVLALCPFACRWVDLHPDYHDVARRPRAGETAAVDTLIAADRTMRMHRDGGAAG